jgi:hypothetical protein
LIYRQICPLRKHKIGLPNQPRVSTW